MIYLYLVDYLGVHCGMHYYIEAFKEVLRRIPGIEVRIMSNYSYQSGEKSFFHNQYKGNIVNKGVSLLRNVLKFDKFVRNNRNSIFIYLTYGNRIDIPFIKIVSKASNHIIDIHEAIAQDIDSNINLKNRFRRLYKNRVKNVISHSLRTDKFLIEYGFEGKKFEVPHFKYIFPKEYDISAIPLEILNSIEKNRINLLFFGNINNSKGIDILLDAINSLSPEVAERVNLIIAGKDFDGTIGKVAIKKDRKVSIFKRHISDDELRFLYQNVDYVVLPYRKTSQSGILEMAFYFKKPIIASDIPYFRKMLTLFPSFGILAGNGSQSFADVIEKIVCKSNVDCYFTQEDFDRYNNRNEINGFVNEISKWINRIDYNN